MIKKSTFFGSLLILLSFTTTVIAAEIDIADIITGKGDPRSSAYLNMVFGPLFEGPNETTLVSLLIFSFNVLFFAVGLVLLTYNFLVGVTETAHEGEIMGRRHSAMWVPLRTVLACASLAPVMPNGYNGVQYVMAYAVNMGTATATFFWDQTVDLVVEQKMPVAGTDFAQMDGQFLQALWRMELCQAVYNLEVNKGGSGLENIGRNWSVKSGVLELEYSLKSRIAACGKVTMPTETAGFSRLAESVGTEQGKFKIFIGKMQDNVDEMVKQFEPIATSLAEAISKKTDMPKYRDLAADMKKWRDLQSALLNQYMGEDRVNQAAKNDLDKDENIIITTPGDNKEQRLSMNLKNGGWTQAGFYYQLIARLSADSNSVAAMMPTTTPGGAIGGASNPSGPVMNAVASQYAASNTYIFGSAQGDAAKFLNQISATYNGTVDWWNESVNRSGIKAFTNERLAFADNGGDLSNIWPSAGAMYESMAFLNPTASTVDPMIGLIVFATQISAWAAAAITALTLAAMIPYIGQGAIAAASTVGWIISGLIVMSFFLAFILPMIPTIIWIMAVSAYVLLICEAVFAGPLWAIAHMSMEGAGIAGQQASKGYVFVLSLILTPVLMLFGLLIGMIVFRFTGTLVNGGIYYALTSAQSLTADSISQIMWFTGIFVVMVFMGFVYLVILERSFSLISYFPGRVFRWFDEIGDNLDSQSAARVNAAGLGSAIEQGKLAGASAERSGAWVSSTFGKKPKQVGDPQQQLPSS